MKAICLGVNSGDDREARAKALTVVIKTPNTTVIIRTAFEKEIDKDEESEQKKKLRSALIQIRL